MTTFNTGNPIGSTDARDRLDNSENMDILENSTTLNAHADRLGTMRKTRKGMELEHNNQMAAHDAEHNDQISTHDADHNNQMQSFENDFDGRLAGMAFTRIGTFTAGATLTDMRQTLLWEVSQGGDGREYGWTGSFLPSGKVVSAGSSPTPISAGNWADRTNDTLRDELFQSGAGISESNAVDIANLVGFDFLEKRKPRKLMSKLFSAASSVSSLKIIPFGDSLAFAKIQQVTSFIDRRFGGTSMMAINTAGNVAGTVVSNGGDLAITYSGTVTSITGDYSRWFTGLTSLFTSGSSAPLIKSGVNPTFSRIRVFYIKEPGAGTLSLSVGGSVVASADANSLTQGCGVIEYTKTYGQSACLLSASSGDVRVVFAHADNMTNLPGVDLYTSFATGGLSLANGMSYLSARNNLSFVLSVINPDLITFEMDDDFGDSSTNDAAFSLFKSVIDSSIPVADKLFIGSTPRASSDELKIRSGNYLRSVCAKEGADYLFFDSYRIMGSHSDMNAIFGSDDGTHPTASAQAFASESLIGFLSLNAFNLGKVPSPINSPQEPSILGWNTRFMLAQSSDRGSDLSIETDNSLGYDWNLVYPRTLSFKSRGAYGTSSSVVWQFSSNTSVNPNVMPLSLDFISPGNVRKLATSTGTGIEFTQFKKTDNPGGGFMHMQLGLIRSSFTRAELLAINANSVLGSIAFCSDCTGGAQLVYARGLSPADWVTVDGKSAI